MCPTLLHYANAFLPECVRIPFLEAGFPFRNYNVLFERRANNVYVCISLYSLDRLKATVINAQIRLLARILLRFQHAPPFYALPTPYI